MFLSATSRHHSRADRALLRSSSAFISGKKRIFAAAKNCFCKFSGLLKSAAFRSPAGPQPSICTIKRTPKQNAKLKNRSWNIISTVKYICTYIGIYVRRRYIRFRTGFRGAVVKLSSRRRAVGHLNASRGANSLSFVGDFSLPRDDVNMENALNRHVVTRSRLPGFDHALSV